MGRLRPGFGFRPNDEELVNYYLRKKMNGDDGDKDVIAEIDVFKRDPSELPGLSARETSDPEWFFFCPVHRNYPNGRLGRSTDSGYWKPTGNDRKIKSRNDLIGMKKTLVFYKRRGTSAERTDWVIHEYRATPTAAATAQSRFVLCRVFDKRPKPAISEPVPELTPVFLTPIFDIANMKPHVDQSSGCAPVSEEKQMTNLFESEEQSQERNLRCPLYSPEPTLDHYGWSQMSHNEGEFQDHLYAGNPSFSLEGLWN